MRFAKPLLLMATAVVAVMSFAAQADESIQLGPRPFFLVEDMPASDLKDALKQCENGPFYKSDFSIGHRGAPLQFPDHTKESYEAGAKMGAGILECDVTFTRDRELVCRHSQCDLHTTTNILETPLANKCDVKPNFSSETPFKDINCCTSDITLAEFKTLRGKMDAGNPNAKTVAEYLDSTPNWRTDLYSGRGTLLTHAESIELFKKLGVKMAPELKTPRVKMPFRGFTQEAYAARMIREYRRAGVPARDVYPQSFLYDDIKFWIRNNPHFGRQAVFLESIGVPGQIPAAIGRIPTLVADRVQIVAPPIWALLALDQNNKIVPSEYAKAIKAAGLKIITWSFERSGLLKHGGGFFYQSIANGVKTDGDMMVVLDVLAKDVGIMGIFSDWPATTTYYANCMGLK